MSTPSNFRRMLSIAAAADDGVWIWDVNPDSIHRTADAQRVVGASVGKKQKNKIENVAVAGNATTSTSTQSQ
jgi:hypothetical protein